MANTPLTEADELVLEDVRAWRLWLDTHEDTSDGVWLRLAKKGVTTPTSLSYAEALDEALCSGWIDGQLRSRDDTTFHRRFTPRRPRSMWSARNVEHITRLRSEARMRPRGELEVTRARGDGRWERAYAGSATAQVPEDLAAALALDPAAKHRFDSRTRAERYSALHGLMVAASPATRARRLARILAELQGDPDRNAPGNVSEQVPGAN